MNDTVSITQWRLRIAFFLCLFCLFSDPFCGGQATAVPHEGFTTLTVGSLHDDNALLDLSDRESRTAQALDLRLRHGRLYQLSPRQTFTWNLDARRLDFSNLNPLDQTHAGLRLSWRWKLGVGPHVPWWRFSAGFNAQRFSSSLRNRNVADALLEVGKRLDDRLSAVVYLGKESSRGVNSRFFGGEAVTAGLNGEFQLSDRLTFLAGYELRDGSLTTTSTPGTEPIPWVRDPDFTSRATPGRAKWIYRLDNWRSNRVLLGLRLAQTRNSSWNLFWERLETEKRDDWYYQRTQIRFAYVRSL